MAEREVAWRIFAAEFNDSNMVVGGSEERSPSYLISPLGARINRVFVVGVITDIENLGTPAEPLWRARLSDPSGTFYVSAGQFQPEASVALSKIRPPAYVAIIGKVRTYSPEEGVLYVSIRPEVVREVDEDVREYWILESARSLKERLEAYDEARNMANPSVEEMMELGYGQNLSMGVITALDNYPDLPTDRYHSILEDALGVLLPENKSELGDIAAMADQDLEPDAPDYDDMEEEAIEIMAGDIEPEEDYDFEEEPAPKKGGKAKPGKGGGAFDDDDEDGRPEGSDEYGDDEELSKDEIKVLELVEKLDGEGSGVEWSDLENASKKAKITRQSFEAAVMGLLDKGLVYEPILGKIRKI